MPKEKKKIGILIFTVFFSLLLQTGVYAGSWHKDAKGWWYQYGWSFFPQEGGEDSPLYYTKGWKWIGGKCYYFDQEGYCLLDTISPDGYKVNASGAWEINGKEQKISDFCSNVYDEAYDNRGVVFFKNRKDKGDYYEVDLEIIDNYYAREVNSGGDRQGVKAVGRIAKEARVNVVRGYSDTVDQLSIEEYFDLRDSGEGRMFRGVKHDGRGYIIEFYDVEVS
ncbi:MAG: hypothetical protein Q4A19_02300 [Johnsonella sp.]|nr:hypothetical protein [Johnsonella sp.]